MKKDISRGTRLKNKKEKRENKIKMELVCQIIRINPDEKDFNIFIEIGKTYNHINE